MVAVVRLFAVTYEKGKNDVAAFQFLRTFRRHRLLERNYSPLLGIYCRIPIAPRSRTASTRYSDVRRT